MPYIIAMNEEFEIGNPGSPPIEERSNPGKAVVNRPALPAMRAPEKLIDFESLYRAVNDQLEKVIDAGNDLKRANPLLDKLYQELLALPNERILVIVKAKELLKDQKLKLNEHIKHFGQDDRWKDRLEKDKKVIKKESTKVQLLKQVINRCNAMQRISNS